MKKDISGLDIYTDTYEDIIGEITSCIESKQKRQICALNVYKMAYIYKSSDFYEKIRKIELLIADGVSIVLLCAMYGYRVKERITGVALFEKLLEKGDAGKWKVFLLGAKPAVIQETQRRIHESFPNLNVVGCIDGYFKDENSVINEINEAKPDILFVAMGSPIQEDFLDKNRTNLNATIFMGLGGTFDVFSGLTPRAPRFFQSIGLEWLYRMIREPSKYFKRYSNTIPVFVYHSIRNYFVRK
ncbi:N-acetylmannosaminyltransferase [Lunatimonas lonarensis]|uniref:N-acetylmannosaminyltransferase n=1 Tax=Lunatimonas lonarensis TaxID=1232681 RepID=R7ZNL0_9BACT|nr:WecB/TagA/CpsF family glycosyltransferase [Lunatimonas lonarensis]EON75609.1 N-acetylmannosaminyltransferase [Lunatimonas lonarensis]